MPFPQRLIVVGCCLIPLLLLDEPALATPIGYSVRAHTGGHLYSIDLVTGAATDLGDLNGPDVDFEGLAYLGDSLFAVTGATGAGGSGLDELWNIATPPGSMVGNTGPRLGNDAGLDSYAGFLYNVQAPSQDSGGSNATNLYRIDPATGAATLVGSSTVAYTDGLAISASGVGYAVDGGVTKSLYTISLATGAMALVGALGPAVTGTLHVGLAFDHSTGVLWMTTHVGKIYTINTVTGAASFVANISAGDGFEGLAIANSVVTTPEPGTLMLFGLGAAFEGYRRRRAARTADVDGAEWQPGQ